MYINVVDVIYADESNILKNSQTYFLSFTGSLFIFTKKLI